MSEINPGEVMPKKEVSMPSTDGFVVLPQTFQEFYNYAKLIAASDMVPKDYRDKPGNVVIAIQMGQEMGLKPLQAIQNIAVINGRPSVWGDAVPALLLSSGICDVFDELSPDEAIKEGKGRCTLKRKGSSKEYTVTFTIEDAKKAGLWGKAGPWTNYPGRMLQMRARGFAVRDKFPDVLKGLAIVEEAQDVEVSDAKPKPNYAEMMPKRASEVAQLEESKAKHEPVDFKMKSANDESVIVPREIVVEQKPMEPIKTVETVVEPAKTVKKKAQEVEPDITTEGMMQILSAIEEVGMKRETLMAYTKTAYGTGSMMELKQKDVEEICYWIRTGRED